MPTKTPRGGPKSGVAVYKQLSTTPGQVVEEVDALGNSSTTNPFQSTDGDDDL